MGSDITRRDFYAAHALQGILANPTWNTNNIKDESRAFNLAATLANMYASAAIGEANLLKDIGGPTDGLTPKD